MVQENFQKPASNIELNVKFWHKKTWNCIFLQDLLQ